MEVSDLVLTAPVVSQLPVLFLCDKLAGPKPADAASANLVGDGVSFAPIAALISELYPARLSDLTGVAPLKPDTELVAIGIE